MIEENISTLQKSIGLFDALIGLSAIGAIGGVFAFAGFEWGILILTNVVGAILGFYFGTQTR